MYPRMYVGLKKCFCSFLVISWTVSVPSLENLVNGELRIEKAIQFLLWITRMPLTSADIQSIPSNFLIDVVVCMYLLKTEAIGLSEATCLMQTIVDSQNDSNVAMQYPKLVSERAFRISTLYSKIFIWIHSCFAAVGLRSFTVRINEIPIGLLGLSKFISEQLEVRCFALPATFSS